VRYNYFGNKILAAQRRKKEITIKMEFPGGKVEENENEECIVREIKEEINVEIEIVKKLANSIYDYGAFKINLIPFIANYISGEIKL
jgi:8-oxo-dGTP diphosphatase